jgi:hypothetical protein
MCLLRFDIKENFNIEDFTLLWYPCHQPLIFLNVSALQRNELLLEVSTLWGPELHLNVSALQRPVLLLEVSTPQEPELHLDMSALQRHVLLMEVSATEAWAESGRVCNTEVCVAPGGVYTLGLELHLGVSNLQGPVHTYCRMCSLCFKNNILSI